MSFNETQVQQLLRPINEKRVLSDGKGHSHVSQQDVLAHLIRCFGFGNFDIDVLTSDLVFEDERADDKGVATGRWDVCYRAMVRLTVKDPHGQTVCHYENGSTATAQNQKRGDGHDLAYKSAISLSVKRAAIALGDGFGLSLYNKGQTDALVKGTLIHPDLTPHADGDDVQAGVPQQVSLGNDEVDPDLEAPKPKQVKASDMDARQAAARGVSVEQERADRLAEAKVRRDALGVDSTGRVKGEEKGRVTRSTGPDADDPWAGRADPHQPAPEWTT